jgi:hypothetical protein
MEWAKTMLSGDTNDPMFLREVIENYKLRVCTVSLEIIYA